MDGSLVALQLLDAKTGAPGRFLLFEDQRMTPQNLFEMAALLGWSAEEQKQLKAVYTAALAFDRAVALENSDANEIRLEKT